MAKPSGTSVVGFALPSLLTTVLDGYVRVGEVRNRLHGSVMRLFPGRVVRRGVSTSGLPMEWVEVLQGVEAASAPTQVTTTLGKAGRLHRGVASNLMAAKRRSLWKGGEGGGSPDTGSTRGLLEIGTIRPSVEPVSNTPSDLRKRESVTESG
jgi:hypothetical protein